MVQGTTPTFTFSLSDKTINLLEADNVYATIEQGFVNITKTGEYIEVAEHSVKLWLTQKESLSLRIGKPADVQLNWTYTDDLTGTKRRAATKKKEIVIEKQLLRKEIELMKQSCLMCRSPSSMMLMFQLMAILKLKLTEA